MARKTIETKEVKVTQDKKQTKVAIPAEFVEQLKINPKSDSMTWVLIKVDGEFSLNGILKRQ